MSNEATPARGPGRPPKAVEAAEAAPAALKFIEVETVRKIAPGYLPDDDGEMRPQTAEIKTTVPPGTVLRLEASEASKFISAGAARPTPNTFR